MRSIQGLPLCWEIVSAKRPVLTFGIGMQFMNKYCNGMVETREDRFKQWDIQATLHVGVVLIVLPSSTSILEGLCEEVPFFHFRPPGVE